MKPARGAAANTRGPESTSDRELVITRVFDAPRELVFKAWTDPEHVANWWGPHGFTVTSIEMDVRPGGKWRKCMRSPAGKEYWRHGVYQEVVEPERLVFTYFSDDLHSDPGHEMVVTITFAEQGGKTMMIFRQAEFLSVAERDAHRGGWTESIERCAVYLAAL